MFIHIIKLVLFIISNIGTWELLQHRTRIDKYFFPSITIAMQTTLLFIAGQLNLLYETTRLLWIIGIAYFCVTAYKARGIKFLKKYLNVGFIFLGITMIIMLAFVRGKIFVDYDNFSHWALVVKNMLKTDRYPTFKDTLIDFQEYPLGSATYIYFFTKLISTSESMQMLAQIYMMLACILPVFIFCKKNSIVANALTFLVVLATTNFLFVYNISITNLLVDTLLPIVSMCGLLFVYRYCNKCEDISIWIFGSFYLIQIIQIKNSGLFFCVIAALWILAKGKKEGNNEKRIGCILMVFLSLFLWQKHCKYVFDNAAHSKHAMTMTNYKSMIGEKTVDDIKNISLSMFKFTFTYKDVLCTFAMLAIVSIMVYCFIKQLRGFMLKITAFSVVMYIIYQFSMLGMYIFSMPMGEASRLAGNTRYTKTILIAIIYLLLICCIKIISEFEQQKIMTVTVTLTAVCMVFAHMYFSLGKITFAILYQDNPAKRNWLESAKKEYVIPNGDSYCIMLDKKDSGYMYYIGKYVFESNNVSGVVIESIEELDKITAHYVFLYDEQNSMIQDWVDKNYPEQSGNRVIVRGD